MLSRQSHNGPSACFFRSPEGASPIRLDSCSRLDIDANPPARASALCAGGNASIAILSVLLRTLGTALEPGLRETWGLEDQGVRHVALGRG